MSTLFTKSVPISHYLVATWLFLQRKAKKNPFNEFWRKPHENPKSSFSKSTFARNIEQITSKSKAKPSCKLSTKSLVTKSKGPSKAKYSTLFPHSILSTRVIVGQLHSRAFFSAVVLLPRESWPSVAFLTVLQRPRKAAAW